MHISTARLDTIQQGAPRDRAAARGAAPLNVLHVAETMKGGVGTMLRSLLEHQIGQFGKESVAAVVPDAHAAELDGLPDGNLILFERTGRNLRSLVSLGAAFRKALVRRRPNVVHLHSSFAGALGRLLLAHASSPKVIYTPHAFPFIMECGSWKKRLYGFAEARLAGLADAIVCVSDFERNAAVEAGIRADRLHRIFNGVPLPEPAGHASAGSGESPIKLLFVGRFDRQKGLDVLLSAMERLPAEKFRLTVVGAGVNDTAGHPRLSNIDYRGWVPHSDLGQFYAGADVLVMPSRWEGFALVPLEALSHGVAVVASRCGSMLEVIEHGESGLLFEVDDSRELAALLAETPHERWREMGRVGKARVEARFTSAKMRAATVELYQSVLGRITVTT